MLTKLEQSKTINKIYGSVWIYKDAKDNWVRITSPEIGDVKQSVRSDDHHGWLLCDGRYVSRTTYADLYDIVGGAYGPTTGSTFRLPDARGRVLGSIGTGYSNILVTSGSTLTTRALGAFTGTETHTLTNAEMPSHSHTSNAVGGTLGLMTADGSNTAIEVDASGTEPNLYDAPVALTINATGGSGAHNNMQPTLFIGNTFIFGAHQI